MRYVIPFSIFDTLSSSELILSLFSFIGDGFRDLIGVEGREMNRLFIEMRNRLMLSMS